MDSFGVHQELMHSCEFCAEFNGIGPRRLDDRALFIGNHLVVVPSLGALHVDHILVCTKEHRTGLQYLSGTELAELNHLITRISGIFAARYGDNYVAFENGTRRGDEAGCSVVHFHMHFVPLTADPHLEALEDQRVFECDRLTEAVAAAATVGSYVLTKRPNNPFHVARRAGLPSQFMRKLVAHANGRPDWDWRKSDLNPDWTPVRRSLLSSLQSRLPGTECNAGNHLAASGS